MPSNSVLGPTQRRRTPAQQHDFAVRVATTHLPDRSTDAERRIWAMTEIELAALDARADAVVQSAIQAAEKRQS